MWEEPTENLMLKAGKHNSETGIPQPEAVVDREAGWRMCPPISLAAINLLLTMRTSRNGAAPFYRVGRHHQRPLRYVGRNGGRRKRSRMAMGEREAVRYRRARSLI